MKGKDKTHYGIEIESINDFNEQIKELDALLTDRISDLHKDKVNLAQQERHAFILYRDRLWKLRSLINDNLK